MPPGCLLGVCRVSAGCLLGVSWVSPGCLLGVALFLTMQKKTSKTQGFDMFFSTTGLLGVSWVSPGVSWVSPGCLLGVSWVSPGCLLGVSWVSPGCLLGVALFLTVQKKTSKTQGFAMFLFDDRAPAALINPAGLTSPDFVIQFPGEGFCSGGGHMCLQMGTPPDQHATYTGSRPELSGPGVRGNPAAHLL